ncbi:MAG: hypothetical protein M1826_007616 [Phylliscum demangeonii]|nr:MAG: hypothetical protein M1826_007616 [Phylliscum demangeonii]
MRRPGVVGLVQRVVDGNGNGDGDGKGKMAKADGKRDYYADLELAKTNDITEIKKQFKKLALRYHPDRNPGHENEFNAKFQAIQCAHEILTDSAQKARYDAERARLGHAWATRPNLPPRNPSAAASDFPPPPRPPPARSTTTAGARPFQGSAGANRFSFASAAKSERRTDWESPKDAPRATRPRTEREYKDGWKEWETMNRAANGRRKPDYRPPPHAAKPPEPAQTMPGPSTPQTAPPRPDPTSGMHDHLRSAFPGVRRHSTKASPRTGFSPAPAGGDERAAPSSYAPAKPNRNAYGNPPPEPPPRAPPAPTPTASHADPASQFRTDGHVAHGLDIPRKRTPYATLGGDRTYLGTSPLRRSHTTASSGERYRSASPSGNRPARDPLRTGPRTGPTTPSDSSPQSTAADAKFAAEAGRRARSQSDKDRFDHYYPSDSSDDDDDSLPRSTETLSFMDRLAGDGRVHARRRHRARHYPYPTYSSPAHEAPGSGNGLASGQADDGPPRDWPRKNSAPDVRQPVAPMDDGPRHARTSIGTDAKKNPPFTFVVDDGAHVPTSLAAAHVRAAGPANINMRFSPPNWHGAFTSQPQDYFPPSASGVSRKAVNGSAGDGPTLAPARTSFPPPAQGPLPPPPPPAAKEGAPLVNGFYAAPVSEPAPASATRFFQPEYWAEELKQHSWVPPQAPAAPVSPSLAAGASRKRADGVRPKPGLTGSSSAARVRRVRVAGTGTGTGTVASDDAGSISETASSRPVSEPLSNGSRQSTGSAMDIDSTSPPPAPPSAAATDDHARAHATPTPTPAAAASVSTTVPPSFADDPDADGAASARSAFNLSNLQHVAPFAAGPGRGLHGMDALASTLPFASSVSSQGPGPLLETMQPRRLELPAPPRVQPSPTKALTQTSWEQYLATMRRYMYEWNQFLDRILAHFHSRQLETKEGLTPNWMGLMGEGPHGGYLMYMRGLEEDFRVREHAELAWERHLEAMRAFGRVRALAIEKALQSA